MRKAAEIRLTSEDRATLEGWLKGSTVEQRYARRARIILAAASGLSTTAIAGKFGERPSTVSKWRLRFSLLGLVGLQDAARPGAKPQYGDAAKRILETLDQPPPKGYARWNGRLVAEALGDVSKHEVWRVLREYKIQLQRTRSWCISTDPEFARKAADIVALYLNPPENAVVISVDEKPSIQALERAQGYLRLSNGAAVRGVSHEYKRHGTTTLFGALNVLTGTVYAAHTQRRRRREFLAFMNEVVALYPDQEIHVVLDNLSTHKPKHDRWIKQHPNVHLHFTPTHASWLNQIECWFSILGRGALEGASFTSPTETRRAIDVFIRNYNETAEPFEWTKAEVHPVTPKKYISYLRN
jgi:transposase